MQENDIVDDYARHEELYRKRLALLRESLEFVEQRRRLRRERFSSPDFKHIILRLKQNQTDAHAVKGKNQHLLHMVEDMLTQKQAQLPIMSSAGMNGDQNIPIKELWDKDTKVKDNQINHSPCALGQEEMTMIKACGRDAPKPHQSSTSYIKLQELGSASKCSDADVSWTSASRDTSNSGQVAIRTSEELTHHETSALQAKLNHRTSSQVNGKAPQSILWTTLECNATVVHEDAFEGSVHCESTDSNGATTVHEKANELGWPASSFVHSLEHDFIGQHSKAAFDTGARQQKSEQFPQHRCLEQGGEINSRQNVTLCEGLKDGDVTSIEDVEMPSRFLVADMGNELHDQQKAIIKRKRAALAVFPSKEKLTILDNLYNVIFQWENTLWAYKSEQIWNPSLVFSTIEAAKGGDEKVKELLGSQDSGSRLLICYEAICELMHAFPPENLVPMSFVNECLLATGTLETNVLEWAKNNLLMTYQDADSALFWETLTRHAVYLVAHDLATAKQIASIFTNILLPTSRLKDTSKEECDSARLNLHIFIAVLLSAKDQAAGCSSKAKSCISNDQDCCTQLALCEDDSGLDMQEEDGLDLLPVVKKSRFGVNQEVNESKSSSAAHKNVPSCLSCAMFAQFLPWKKSK